ncbi:translocation/assembly module TamB domain-containing protein [Hoylesella enoeca]|uniref:translocation/assembly module TamB domain-containing protein n=1 Tax=Hoylesella enoeca TaxID=76123 RepID=UPI002889021F|nr:translocation/assembly module TamB domain-containing protein [Hoylesella enoeca]
MKRFKHLITGIIWIFVGLYLLLIILLHIPAVQGFVGNEVSALLAAKLGTKVTIGRVDLGLMNRFIIDDLTILDQKGKPLLQASRLSAKFDYLPLSQGRISISSAQIFGLRAGLYQESAKAKPNFQFVIDSLASKDTVNSTPLDVRIRSLVIRHGTVRYDRWDIAPRTGILSPAHLHLTDISTHILLNAFRPDSLNINLKKLSFNEVSGLRLRAVSFKISANRQSASLKDFKLEMPASHIELGDFNATYRLSGNKIELPSLQYTGSVKSSSVTPADFKWLIPQLKDFIHPLLIASSFSGTSTKVRINTLNIGSNNGSLQLIANGSVGSVLSNPRWYAHISDLRMSAAGIKFIADNFGTRLNLPVVVTRLGNIHYRGDWGGHGSDMSVSGILQTDAGQAHLILGKQQHQFNAQIETQGLDLKRLLDNHLFGEVATRIAIDGTWHPHGLPTLTARGVVSKLEYNAYTYHNLSIDGSFHQGTFEGIFGMDDPNGQIAVKGRLNFMAKTPSANLIATVRHLNPSQLHLSQQWPGTTFDFNLAADFTGKTLNTAVGKIDLTDFLMKSEKRHYALSSLKLSAANKGKARVLTLNSDFGTLIVNGKYDYETFAQSFINFVGSKIPTLPGLPRLKKTTQNDFAINATVMRSDWLQQLFDIPLALGKPFHIQGRINDKTHEVDLLLDAPDFSYEEKRYTGGHVRIQTPNDTLMAVARINKFNDEGNRFELNVHASAADNQLSASIAFDSHTKRRLRGVFNCGTRFFKTETGVSAARINVRPSNIMVGDTVWNVKPADIIYSKNHLEINNFTIAHHKQHIILSGLATQKNTDSLFVDLKDMDVNYILNLIDFHSVEFSGLATGRAYIAGAFSKPQAAARLTVDQFRFENGQMGILTANVDLNNRDEQIDINAIANDGPLSQTLINGYVSPKRDRIDLAIHARNTRAAFLESFCGSFMRNVNVFATGDLRLYGPLSDINLAGDITANGTLDISSLNTTYTLKNDRISLIPDQIRLMNDTIYDRRGQRGVVSGSLYHKSLRNLSFNIGVKAENLLALDLKETDGNSFYGTVFATGNCTIRGKSGEVNIDVDARSDKSSEVVYNTTSPDAINNHDFIHWKQAAAHADTTILEEQQGKPMMVNEIDIPTDIHLNLLMNIAENATLKVIMDAKTGDYIALNGSGVIRATYYNKGGLDMFGNYLVNHGIYKLTVQDVIKKDFQFKEGGTITFGGDPYNARLNLIAQYTVNGVSLSDLQLGRSFSGNNIRVNCQMKITGTPNTPKIDFGLDMPTVNSDAKQMIYSLINSEEEMNQQVLYLLTIGRFYHQGNNNARTDGSNQQSQTSLAMQSLLSGTLSQQINNVLSSVVNNTNWNFGANISTGDEGWNNAEYEGLLSGRLFNNRLLINGQFGYRDNPNATTSFIGDFDIRYLLFPSGNLAIKVYNQTNDRYFTRNSLNTQGLGFIMKKDFNGLRDLFGIQRKKKLKKQQQNNK